MHRKMKKTVEHVVFVRYNMFSSEHGGITVKILLTGARGFVGSRIAEAMEVVPAPSLRTMTDDEIRRIVEETGPDVIIHTAAISDIGDCTKDPEGSCRANVEIPLALVRTGVKTVLFSTDQVYSGRRDDGPYTEDMVAPANLYAEHKLEMERRALEKNPDTIILRAAWMYDMPKYGVKNRRNFLVNMLLERELAFSSTQYRGVSYAREVAEHMRQAVKLPGGVYNYGSENSLTMLETARWLADELRLDIRLRDAGPRHNLWMDGAKLRAHGIVFRDTVGGLRRCIEDYALNMNKV